MIKECPICRLNKDGKKFNTEHPIPETIGGFYEIKICKECNILMNKNIDEPFLSNPQVLQFRNIFDTKKQSNRKIRSQLKYNDEKYTYYFRKNGKLNRHLKPQIPQIDNIETGNKVEITIDKEDLDKIDGIIDKIEKRKGVKLEIDKIINNKTQNEKIIIEYPNTPIVLELVKITYEIAINEIPEYYNDKDAIKLSKMLYSGKINSKLYKLIQPHESEFIFERIKDKINTIISMYDFVHFIYFKGIKNVGLISFIQIYNFRRILVLSQSEIFENYPEKLIVNKIKR